MNVFQIAMLSIAGLLVGSIFWEQLKTFFSKGQKVIDNTLPNIIKPKRTENRDSLVAVVAAWDHLKQECEKQDLTRAVRALKTIFPLFVIEDGDEADE